MAKKEQGEFFRDDAPHSVPTKDQILHNVVDTKVSHVQIPFMDYSTCKWYGF